MKRYIIPIVLGVALVLGGVLLYWHFVINQVLDRNGMEHPFPPDDTELPGIPMDAALLSLNWSQSAMSFAECFHFDLAAEDSGYVISGECADPENGERVERENAPLTAEDWAKVEQCLRDGEHRAKTELPEGVEVCDAASSTLSVTWRTTEGDTVSTVYNGEYESELRELLTALLAAAPVEYATP